MDRTMMSDERLDPCGSREHTALGLSAIRAASAVDHVVRGLLGNLIAGQSGKHSDTQSNIDEGLED